MEKITLPKSERPDFLRNNRWLLRTIEGLQIDEMRIREVHFYDGGSICIVIPLLETDNIDAMISYFNENKNVPTTFEFYLLDRIGVAVVKRIFEDLHVLEVDFSGMRHFSYLDDSAVTLNVYFSKKIKEE